jgi:hypothetical protein
MSLFRRYILLHSQALKLGLYCFRLVGLYQNFGGAYYLRLQGLSEECEEMAGKIKMLRTQFVCSVADTHNI